MSKNQSKQSLKAFFEVSKTKISNVYRRFQKWSSEHPYLGWSVKIGAGLFLGAILSIFLLVGLVRFGVFGKLPTAVEIEKIQNHNASEIYSADEVLLGKYYIENRTDVEYKDISTDLIHALIATEDARFFEHQGVDKTALLRVFFKTILGRDVSSGGGSTLSQQLAKNVFKRRSYSFLTVPVNKIKEMYIARQLERAYTKEELINLYLNTVPFGYNVYGIQVAARQFFSKTPATLSTEEAALLIGMLKANTRYNPIRNPELAVERRNVVLGQMLKYNYINEADYERLKVIPLNVSYSRDSKNEGTATYFREHLRQFLDKKITQLNETEGTDYNIYTDGLKIYTTVDSRMQRAAEEAVNEHMALLQKDFDQHWKGQKPWGDDQVIENIKRTSRRYQSLKKAGKSDTEINTIFDTPINMTIFDWQKGDVQKEISPLDSIKYYFCLLNAGFMAMDHKSGNIKAWVGGIDFQYFQYDHVKSKRSVGSTFKPIVYSTALEQGIEPCEYTHNRLVIYTDYEDWKPENANNQYGGVYSMEGALSGSINSVTVSTIMKMPLDTVVDMAHKMGISSDIPAVPAIALGAVDASLYEMVNVYGTLANHGVRPELQFIDRIEDSDGNVILDFSPDESSEWERILTEENAHTMVHMMQSVVDSGTARRLRYQYHLENDIAGKTGTTQNQSDGWFIGFTPDLVAGVWVGGASPLVRFRSLALGSGSNMALPIWGRFMNKVYKEKEFSQQRFARFDPLPDSTLYRLQCPPYLDEMPVLDTLWQYAEDNPVQDAVDKVIGIFRKDRPNVNTSPSRNQNKTRSQRSEEIRRKNERIKKKKDRQKRRKKTFDRIFKRND